LLPYSVAQEGSLVSLALNIFLKGIAISICEAAHTNIVLCRKPLHLQLQARSRFYADRRLSPSP